MLYKYKTIETFQLSLSRKYSEMLSNNSKWNRELKKGIKLYKKLNTNNEQSIT